ncbi:MAG TPA: transporter substrate-binding domain-containing protein [bacterium]|nr:transporter substrate-binding domain-containing protein [bacterium]
MTGYLSRRIFVKTLALAGITLPIVGALRAVSTSPVAAAPSGLLNSLRQAKVVRIALANQPPYSALKPDGTVTGIGPIVVQTVMARLGVPRVEGIIAPYANLIPGLQAQRWDIIGAVFNISKARCAQVLYADPLVFDGASIAYFPSETPSVPKSIADIGRLGLTVGILSGSYLIQRAEDRGVAPSNVQQFPDNPSLIDGLTAKRVKVVLAAYSAMRDLRKARNNQFELSYPLPDDPPSGGSPAFRKTDLDLYVAFQRELRAMSRSGELDKLRAQFGFEVPKELRNESADEACMKAS